MNNSKLILMNTNHTNDVELAYNHESKNTLITFNMNFPSKITLSGDSHFWWSGFYFWSYNNNPFTINLLMFSVKLLIVKYFVSYICPPNREVFIFSIVSEIGVCFKGEGVINCFNGSTHISYSNQQLNHKPSNRHLKVSKHETRPNED